MGVNNWLNTSQIEKDPEREKGYEIGERIVRRGERRQKGMDTITRITQMSTIPLPARKMKK